MADTPSKSLTDLYRKVEITTRTRHNAAYRLISHHRHSQWTITMISVVLILIPLFQAMDVPLRYNSQLLNAAEVFLAVLVLAYSLLLGSESYQLRSDKMQNCGLELGKISREMLPFLDSDIPSEKYYYFSNAYHEILIRYENHDDIDYDNYRLKNHSKFFPEKHMAAYHWLRTILKYHSGFIHYYFAFIVAGTFLWFLFTIESVTK